MRNSILNEEQGLQTVSSILYVMHNGVKIKLTSRQMECLFYLIRGKTAKEIAKILSISHRTVECYFDKIKYKLQCQNRREVINQIVGNDSILRYLL